MGIILAVLKILGILLLIILGVFLSLAALILLVPVRYRLECLIDRPEKDREEPGFGRPHGWVRITWLMRLVSLTLSYEGKAEICLRVLGIRLLPGKKRGGETESILEDEELSQNGMERIDTCQEKALGEERPALEETASKRDEEGPEQEGRISNKEDGEKSEGRRSEEKPPSSLPFREGTARDREEEREGSQEDADGEKISLLERICRVLRRIVAWFSEWYRNTERAVNRLADRVESIKGQCRFYLELLGGEDARRLYQKTADVAGGVLRHVKPQQMLAELEVGTGNPASTGQILALWGMLYPFLGENIRIIPNFERKYLEGEIHIKGRIRACVILFHGLRMVLDRRLWRLIRQLKKGGRR